MGKVKNPWSKIYQNLKLGKTKKKKLQRYIRSLNRKKIQRTKRSTLTENEISQPGKNKKTE